MNDASLEQLYETALTRGVVIDRTGRGLFALTGPQRVWFLQNTITADVDDLEPGSWRESCFLTSKGKLISHFRVGAEAERIWLDVDPPAGDLGDWLVRYRFRTRVDIEDRSGPVTTVVGAPAADMAPNGAIVARDATVAFGAVLGDVAVADVHGAHDVDLPVAGEELLEIFRIEAGVARFGVDYTTDHLPQEAGLTAIVPVDKGCYVGQETVARIHFRGHVNRVVRPLELQGVVPADAIGRDISFDGSFVGRITSAATSPRRGGVAMAMVRVEPPAGAELEISGGGVAILGPVPAGTKVKKT